MIVSSQSSLLSRLLRIGAWPLALGTALLWYRPTLAAEAAAPPGWPWWLYPLALFLFTLALGVLAVLAGVGGGVLFVPLVASFAPFVHIDFIRGAGLMVAITGAVSAGPGLIRQGLTDLRLSIPLALVASAGSIVGAVVGLQLPVQAVQLALGLTILGTGILIWRVKPSEPAKPGKPDRLARALAIRGRFEDPASGESRDWEPRRLLLGLALFAGVGFMAGMFGLGAGWANVPVLNLVMGLPLKFSVATSYFLLSMTVPAALVYLTRGAMVPLIIVPTVLGIMLGARIGSWLLVRTHPRTIRIIVIAMLVLAGLRSTLRGVGL